MKIKIQITIESDKGQPEVVQEVAQLNRGSLRPESLGLTVMGQMAKSINTNDQPNLSAEVEKELERLKWNLWHGNVHKALQIVDDLEFALDVESIKLSANGW